MNRLTAYTATVVVLLLGLAFPAGAQNGGDKMTKEDIENHRQRIRQLVQFFEYSLNILGNDTVPASDKESIITSSYLKIFRDEKVQVEDDLDERKTVTNKNIRAYLQDVDYFFRDVKFTFDILDISPFLNDRNRTYFKVTLNRNLKGITLDGKEVNNNKKRYIEINLEPKRKELKIVSIYTDQVNEEEELRKWWTGLRDSWQQILLGAAGISDTNAEPAGSVLQIKELDLSIYPEISDIAPLERLSNLVRLNISGTSVQDILPLLDLTYLEYLDLSHTPVRNLQPLKYSLKLKELRVGQTAVENLETLQSLVSMEKLDINNTPVKSLEPLAGMSRLQQLNCSATGVSDLSPVAGLTELRALDCSYTAVSNTEPLRKLIQLDQLNASSSGIASLEPLSGLTMLKWLNISNTPVASITPLNGISALQNLYCDNTAIPREEIMQYIRSHTSTLVVYESETSSNWWNGISQEWKNYFSGIGGIKGSPSKEQLAALARVTEVDISGNKGIKDLAPLTQLTALKSLKAANTSIRDLKPLAGLGSLEYADVSGTAVADLTPLMKSKTLKRLKCNNTKIKTEQISRFKAENPQCTVIFKTEYLSGWWAGLSPEWKTVFLRHLSTKGNPDEDQLHQLLYKDSLYIDNRRITSLLPLNDFVSLRVLIINQSQIGSLDELKAFPRLERLQCSNSPLQKLDGLTRQVQLKHLDLSNTAVKDLEKLKEMKSLLSLNIAGTKVKNLKDVKELTGLSSLNCSNTRICSLNPVSKSTVLSSLTCFNTRLKPGRVERFRKKHPSCEVRYY
jgi:hypothetical protein